MLKTIILPALLLLSLSATAQKKETKAIQKSFDNYKAAIKLKKGEVAVGYVSDNTIQYYTDLLEKIKTADSTEIETLALLDKVTVLSVRHRSEKEEILSLDGRKLFIQAINDGTANANSLDKFKLGKVTINGNSAQIGLTSPDGLELPFYFHLKKEEEVWKLDIEALILSLSGMFEKELGEDKEIFSNENIFMMLEMQNGEKPSPDIWHPLID